MIGGLKASFVADYFNTVFIFIILFIFAAAVYYKFGVTSVYEGLKNLPSSQHMLTMASVPGLLFGMINIIGNFGTVFVDQAYWQRAIASKTALLQKRIFTAELPGFRFPLPLPLSLA